MFETLNDVLPEIKKESFFVWIKLSLNVWKTYLIFLPEIGHGYSDKMVFKCLKIQNFKALKILFGNFQCTELISLTNFVFLPQ